MRTMVFTVAAGLTLVHGIAAAQGSWGRVKTWTGTATAEATETRKFATYTATLTYKATGDFTISDDALGDGDHIMWPMPNPESASDPAKYAAAYEPWQARVTASYEASGKDMEGGSFNTKCQADGQKAARLGVVASPGTSDYVFEISLPDAVFRCTTTGTGSGPSHSGRVHQAALRITGPQGEPGPVTGTKTFTFENMIIKATFSMKPAK